MGGGGIGLDCIGVSLFLGGPSRGHRPCSQPGVWVADHKGMRGATGLPRFRGGDAGFRRHRPVHTNPLCPPEHLLRGPCVHHTFVIHVAHGGHGHSIGNRRGLLAQRDPAGGGLGGGVPCRIPRVGVDDELPQASEVRQQIQARNAPELHALGDVEGGGRGWLRMHRAEAFGRAVAAEPQSSRMRLWSYAIHHAHPQFMSGPRIQTCTPGSHMLCCHDTFCR